MVTILQPCIGAFLLRGDIGVLVETASGRKHLIGSDSRSALQK